MGLDIEWIVLGGSTSTSYSESSATKFTTQNTSYSWDGQQFKIGSTKVVSLLLVSRYVLDYYIFGNSNNFFGSSLQATINSQMDSALSLSSPLNNQKYIRTTFIPQTSYNQTTTSGNATFFLLANNSDYWGGMGGYRTDSFGICSYFGNNVIFNDTAGNPQRVAYHLYYQSDACAYWTRSGGYDATTADGVRNTGYIGGFRAPTNTLNIRPVFVLNTSYF